MTNYMSKVERIFWDHLEDEVLQVKEENFVLLENATRLLELENDELANQEIENNPELKQLFGFEEIRILKDEEISSETEIDELVNSDIETIPETFRMDKKEEEPESSYMGSKE